MKRVLIIAGLVIAALLVGRVKHLRAADLDGRYANSPLKQWFDQIKSGKGLCCSFADGFSIKDADWDTDGSSYRVRLDGEWIVVPDDAVVREPNRYGPAVVWPVKDQSGATTIRCFMAGALS